MNLRFASSMVLTGLLSMSGCGSDDEPCDPIAAAGCDDGQVCEFVQGGEPACFAPLTVRGNVFDLADDSAIEGAHVVAVDINGAPISSVAISDANGDYSLQLPSTRDAEGNPLPVELTLRADAQGFQTFPAGIRQALPIDTSSAVSTNDGHVIDTAQTDIGLIGLAGDVGTGIIFGKVEVPPTGAGVLVVAEGPGGVGFNSIASRDGEYRIFNVPDGAFSVTGYAQGFNYDPGAATIAGNSVEVNLNLDARAPGIVAGDVQIVNAPGGSLTSVVLVVESTFNEALERGQTVPGLRAPEPGIAPNVEGAYSIAGVPVGKYVVLAAFEHDNLAHDPDTSIGGTSTLHIEVTAGATTTVDGFKVTEALAIFSPGATGPESVTEPLAFSWADDSSEDEYLVEVFDSFGTRIWDQSIAGVSGTDPSLDYAGPPLEAGMFYQFRATSIKSGVPLSRTEDLTGVFFLP